MIIFRGLEDFVQTFDYKRILFNYLVKNGYPVVNVNVSQKNVTITAEKFLLYPKSSVKDEKPWKIPLKLVNITPGKFAKTRIHHNEKSEIIIPSNVTNPVIIVSRKDILGKIIAFLSLNSHSECF